MSSRKVKENIWKVLLWLFACIIVFMLVFILGFIFLKGFRKINITFLTADYSPSGDGGILPMIISTLYLSNSLQKMSYAVVSSMRLFFNRTFVPPNVLARNPLLQ